MTENEKMLIERQEELLDFTEKMLYYAKSKNNEKCIKIYSESKKVSETIIKALEELEQYRAIGTVEECREARERQRGKKPKVLNKGKVLSQGEMFVSNAFKCPNCGIKQIYFDGLPKYCDNCGQKLKEA